MTTITIKRKNFGLLSIKLSGHASYVQEGPDILCAALSMASQMLIIGLEEVAHAKVRVREDQARGLMSIEVLSSIDDPEVQTLVKTFKASMLQLSDQYPENIHVYSQ